MGFGKTQEHAVPQSNIWPPELAQPENDVRAWSWQDWSPSHCTVCENKRAGQLRGKVWESKVEALAIGRTQFGDIQW